LIVAFLLPVGIFFYAGTREPMHGGHPLGYWVAQYSVHRAGLFVDSAEQRAAAEMAIRLIGTNALPYLVDWIDYDPGPWRRKLGPHVEKLPGWLQRSAVIQRPLYGGTSRAQRAQLALESLGPTAAPALLELHRLACNSHSTDTRRRAVIALCAIGPSAMTAMTNILATAPFDEQRLIMNSLPKLGTNAAPAVPVLVHQLQYGDLRTATASAQTLATLRLDLDFVIPALSDRLADPHPRMRIAAASSLAQFGTRAFISLPALNQLATDPDKGVSKAASDAIKAITAVAPP